MTNMLWLFVTWLSLVQTKPLNDGIMKTLIEENMSETLRDKADAIDNLLRLLSEIDLPSICDALSAQKTGGDDKMATVDAILAEAAKSQAMTFIPTNLPETSDVTRPGLAPLNFARYGKAVRKHRDGKQASQEVAISKPEGKLDGLSLDVATALNGKKEPKQHISNIDVSVSALSGIHLPKFPRYRPSRPTSTPQTPSNKATTFPITTTPVTRAVKRDTTIPTLASDMMLHDETFGESGDGENTIDTTHTTETYTTTKVPGDSEENKIEKTIDFKYKNIFENHGDKAYELSKGSPLKIPKSTKSPESPKVPTSVYKTFIPSVTNELSAEDSTETTDLVPTVDDDLGWGFTLPTNTTFGEFMFGNITFNQTLSDELASILNSTVPVDFLISNDTIYNEFMSILNDTLDSEEGSQQEPEFDMGLSETGDYKSLIEYISNMTEKLASSATGFNATLENSTTRTNLTDVQEDIMADINNSSITVDNQLNNSRQADFSTYSAKVLTDSDTKTSSAEKKVTKPSQREYIHTKFPEYPPRRGDELKGQTVSMKTVFTAGDYYQDKMDNDINMIAGSENLINPDDLKNPFRHSGFAPLNRNQDYKVNSRRSGLSYLGFDFKNMKKNTNMPELHHDADVTNTVTNQRTIWSEEPAQKESPYPTGYTCPGLFGYYGDAHDCKAFFICSWGVPYRFHCPPGTTWSTEESVCNWSRDVTCKETN